MTNVYNIARLYAWRETMCYMYIFINLDIIKIAPLNALSVIKHLNSMKINEKQIRKNVHFCWYLYNIGLHNIITYVINMSLSALHKRDWIILIVIKGKVPFCSIKTNL